MTVGKRLGCISEAALREILVESIYKVQGPPCLAADC